MNIYNDILLEDLYQGALEAGLTEDEAEAQAYEAFHQLSEEYA